MLRLRAAAALTALALSLLAAAARASVLPPGFALEEEGPLPPPTAAPTALLPDASSSSSPPCTAATKQKALYLHYDIEPPLSAEPATDISVEHVWNSTSKLRAFGANGVFASQPIGTVDGPSGYFGSQATGKGPGALLFSLWDAVWDKHPNASVLAHCASGAAGPNTTWCLRKHSFPLSPNCHRHCLDCGLHPGWHNTSGTQCSISLPDGVADGDSFRFRLFRSKPYGATLTPPASDGCGLSYTGSEWTLTAVKFSNGVEAQTFTVGHVFLEETRGGISRFGAFHEHIGCTPCDSFYESEVRRGPWIAAPNPRSVKSIGFTAPNCSCKLFDVELGLPGPGAQISTGPGTGPGGGALP